MAAYLALIKDEAVLGKDLEDCISVAAVCGEQLVQAAADLKSSTQRDNSGVEEAGAGASFADLTALQ
eukprot:10825339-Lingulodinium_polyedra.AAC.1